LSRAGLTGAALNDQKFFGSFFQKRTASCSVRKPHDKGKRSMTPS
jgi:hypothetical protein